MDHDKVDKRGEETRRRHKKEMRRGNEIRQESR